jgi:hypothetical protein
MSELVWVGLPLSVADEQSVVTPEDELHEHLLSFGESLTRRNLSAQFAESSITLVEALYLRRYNQPLFSLINHVLLSVTQEQLDIHEGRRKEDAWGRGWQEIAKNGLTKWAGRISLAKESIDRSLIINGTIQQLAHLERIAIAALEPSGLYSRYAFVSGVANGFVKPNSDIVHEFLGLTTDTN